MKKRFLALFLPLLLLGSCGKTSTPHEAKTNYGIVPIFDDDLGIYDKDPSVFLEDNTKYIFYTTNEEYFVSGDVIAMRKGTQNDKGEWNFSERKIVLRPSENDWDSMRVSNPDVIRGTFTYQETEYLYLMAFQGTSKVKDKLYQIGFAVSNDLENWVKVGKEPIITYSSYALGSAYGVGAPSLVSYDKKGKFYCFYTYADALVTTTRVNYFDATDLDQILMGEPSTVSTIGLEDKSGSVVFNNADFTIDQETNTLYCVRDRNPVMTLPATSDSVQVAKADLKILTNPNDYRWTLIARGISDLDTAVMDGDEDQSFGWERIYSPCFVRDAYSLVQVNETLDICFTVSATGVGSDNDYYLYSGAITQYEVLI